MENISIHDVEPSAENDIDRRKLADPLNATDIAINRYVLEPSERFSGLHAHADQEEVFIVVSGEATFETMSGEVTVSEGEVLRFAPGEFHSGKNDSAERVVAFALGAPRDSENVRIPLDCPECSHDDMQPAVAEGREVLVCPNCGAESKAACPECAQDAMRAELSETGNAVSICQNCGAESTQ
jgi:uncharacterized cupin superfamily protein